MPLILKNGRLHWLHWLIIFLSVLLTIFAWYISKLQIEEKIKQRFDFQSSQLLALVSERMEHYEDALRAGVAAIHSHGGDIDAYSWKRFSDALKLDEKYLGINGIGVIFYVSAKDKSKFLIRERKLRPNFKIHPLHSKNEYWPITYVEPFKGNELAVGLDMAFEQNRFSASKQARDVNDVRITGPITLVQDEKQTPGFLQFIPFYNSQNLSSLELRRQHFVGHVYAPFIMSKLIKGTLEQNSRHLIFSIYDEGQALYDELTLENPNYTSAPLLRKNTTLELYGRTWKFEIQTTDSFSDGIEIQQSSYILFVGIVIDSMLIILFLILSNSNRKSLSLAEKITEKLEVSEEYFKHIIDAAPCGIIITDDGVIEEINPQVEILFGYKSNEILGQKIDILVPDAIRHKHIELRAGFQESEAKRRMGIDRKVYGLRKNGEEFPAEVGLANFNSSNGRKVLSTIIDMTEYVAVSDELRRSNKDLNDFAYVASHDLKAPLRGIMQLSSWIEEDISEIATNDTKEHLALLQSRTARLEKLLDDLLTYSRVGSHLGDMNTVDVKSLVEELFSLLNPLPEFMLRIEGELPVFETLTTPLEVIFRNLIGNAIKHHDKPNGIITISSTENSHSYQFIVSNDGPGIKSEHQEQIFEMFKTLKPRDEVEGSGMGLAVIKKILQYQGGSIKVFSDGERGVSFVFSWPKKINLTKGL